MRKKEKNLFVSDLHIGFTASKVEKLIKVISEETFTNIFLVGDIIDFWALKRKFYWNQSYNDFFQKLLKLSKKGTNIYYLTGNHDDVVRNFTPHTFGNIHIIDEYILDISGKKYLVVHGDIFDHIVKNYKFIGVFGHILYDNLISFNRIFNNIRLFFGLEYWSIAQYLKLKAKGAVSFMRDYKNVAMEYALSKDCVGIICGHIHNPTIQFIDDFQYINCGDFIENCSYVIEKDGVFVLYHLDK